MRGILLLTMLSASLANSAWRDYSEVRELQLDDGGWSMLEIDSGAGALTVVGVPSGESIRVKATIVVPDKKEAKAVRFIEDHVRLSLDDKGDVARLNAHFEGGFWLGNSDARIDLEVAMPAGLALTIDDGSGSIEVSDVSAAVTIDDGSGAMELRRTGAVEIDDGSGSISIEQASGDVYIEDGSGKISVSNVDGSLRIDDGSGSIRVDGVANDVEIINSGSGSFTYANVGGSVKGDL